MRVINLHFSTGTMPSGSGPFSLSTFNSKQDRGQLQLASFDNADFDRGKSWTVEAAWKVIEGLCFNSWIPGSGWRVRVLRVFGATVGKGVVIKPYVRIKFPWKLRVGDNSWIGEKTWIDNLAEVTIGNNCCLSQGAYLCGGNHRWDLHSFDLRALPIRIEDHCWIGAQTSIAPGITCHEGSVLTLGSVATSDLQHWQIYSGNPAQAVKVRSRAP